MCLFSSPAKPPSPPIAIAGPKQILMVNLFESAHLDVFLLRNMHQSGYIQPKPIQKYAVPNIMVGRDMLACAERGSGKPEAYLIPIINALLIENIAVKGFKPHMTVITSSPTIAIKVNCRNRN